MRTRFAVVGVVALVAGVLVLGACGGGDEEGGEAGGGTGSVVAVELGEFFVKPDKSSVAAGEVTFEVSNAGKLAHEFIVYRSDEDPGSLPIEANQAQLEKDAEIGEIEEEDLEPGASSTLTVTLETGKYILLCNVLGHYGQGQFTAFTAT